MVGFFRYGDCTAWGCPNCGASPRERLVNAALDRGLLRLPENGRILQVAPSEISLVRRFRAQGHYVAGDLHPERYKSADTVRLDILDLNDSGGFDLIYASHVLEHVPDDTRALRNLFAALNPGGELWLLVPLHDAPTVDGHAGMSPNDRERLFGQWDHVRQYGPDFRQRIKQAGFDVVTLAAADFPESEVTKNGLDNDVIFRARKS